MRRFYAFISLLCITQIACATVIISCQDIGNRTVEISYDSSASSYPVKAFALVVSVDNGVFTSVGNYSTDGTGYGTYPGSIVIDGNGVVTGTGSPLVLPGGGLGTNCVVLEMGSLYNPEEEDPPADTGVLLTLTVSENCHVSIGEEETYRGGVILEDGTPVSPIFYGCDVVPEPATVLILGFGGVWLRKKRR